MDRKADQVRDYKVGAVPVVGGCIGGVPHVRQGCPYRAPKVGREGVAEKGFSFPQI